MIKIQIYSSSFDNDIQCCDKVSADFFCRRTAIDMLLHGDERDLVDLRR